MILLLESIEAAEEPSLVCMGSTMGGLWVGGAANLD